MVKVHEGTLEMRFPDHWHVIKYDDGRWHNIQMKSQLKAMDVLASEGDRHWWIEIKDCKRFELNNRPRLSPSDSN